MKIAEALSLRADLQKRLAQLNQRIINNAKVQEGEAPSEEPDKLLEEYDRCIKELEALIANINLTNSRLMLGDKTMTQLLAHRDVLLMRNQMLRSLVNEASSRVNRSYGSEIRILSTVSVPELQKQVDKLSKEIRELDVVIQQANWNNELIEDGFIG